MRLIIVLLLCLCICGVLSRSSRFLRSNIDKCESVRPYFESLNVTVNEINQKDFEAESMFKFTLYICPLFSNYKLILSFF